MVVHQAALIAMPYTYHSPDTYVDTNIKGTLNISGSPRELSVQKVVHTYMSEVYGTAKFIPITEDHPLRGQIAVFRIQDRRELSGRSGLKVPTGCWKQPLNVEVGNA